MELDKLTKGEQVAYQLRNLYDQYGYQKFRMGKFEEYDFYVKNRDFLGSGQILTFTDLTGRLMALKPDVTMSIVKNTQATKAHPEKLYYSESVYRANHDAQEFREIMQIGVEYIGEVTLYTQAEIVTLALKSLHAIEESCMLDVCHAGILNSLVEGLGLAQEAHRQLLACIESKNAHELEALLPRTGVSGKKADRLRAILNMPGTLQESLTVMEPFLEGEEMRRGYEELCSLATLFEGEMEHLRLDFSITSSSKYYNGLRLRGYVNSIPHAILSGGRYDPLLGRMGKRDLQAIGFAVYFDEVERSLKAPAAAGYDAVVLYDESTELTALHAMVEKLVEKGQRVCAAKSLPPHAGAAKIYLAAAGALWEVDT